MSESGSFPPSPGRPFTVWLDPARWPVVPLKLPGKAFTLWQDASRWPVVPLRSAGRGFTLWLDPARWPAGRLKLPGKGFTLWQDPALWPSSVKAAEAGAFPMVEPMAKAESVVDSVLPDHSAEVLTLEKEIIADLSTPPTPDFSTFATETPIMAIPISQNKGFTLWTRPEQVTPIPMKNGLTAAQLAGMGGGVGTGVPGGAGVAPGAGMPPHAIPSSPQALGGAPAPVAGGAGSTPAVVTPGLNESVPFVHRLLPLAAGIVAVLGLHALMTVSRGKAPSASPAGSTPAAEGHVKAPAASTATEISVGGMEITKIMDVEFKRQALEMETRAAQLQADRDRLTAELAAELAATRDREVKAMAVVSGQDARFLKLTQELEQAKLAASTAGNETEARVITATEEASKVKREAAAEVVALRESLAEIGAEKAAAQRAAAEASAALAKLKAQVEAAAKPAP